MLDVSENALLVNSATAATGWTYAIDAVMKEFQVLDGQVRPLTSILGLCVLSGQSHDASCRDQAAQHFSYFFYAILSKAAVLSAIAHHISCLLSVSVLIGVGNPLRRDHRAYFSLVWPRNSRAGTFLSRSNDHALPPLIAVLSLSLSYT